MSLSGTVGPSISGKTVTLTLAQCGGGDRHGREGELRGADDGQRQHGSRTPPATTVADFTDQAVSNDTPSAPAFANATEAREVAENHADGANVGAAVTATDADGDTLTYTLTSLADPNDAGSGVGTDHQSFDDRRLGRADRGADRG